MSISEYLRNKYAIYQEFNLMHIELELLESESVSRKCVRDALNISNLRKHSRLSFEQFAKVVEHGLGAK